MRSATATPPATALPLVAAAVQRTAHVDWMGPILEQIEQLRCPSCGSQLAEGMVRGLSTEEDRLLIRIACAGCGETTLAIVEQVIDDVRQGQPFTRDDVLDAHDILASFEGSPERLFKMAA